MERYNLLLLGLSEVRWTGAGEKRMEKGDVLLYSGKDEGEAHTSGVGIMINKQARKGLIEWNPISDRIITARFVSRVRKVSIIMCYAPTEVSDEEEKDHFYQQLSRTLHNIKRGDIRIMMGDFNAKIGNDNTDRESVMGKHGMGTMNDNGERLADLCLNQSLVIGGSVFPHKDCHKVTWLSPDRKTENQIDHICIDKSWRKSLLDVRNKRGADAGTDHHLIIGVTQLKISSTAVKLQCAQRKWDLVKLKDESKKVQFSMQLKNRFQALRVDDIDDEALHERENPSEKIEKKWKNFKEIFQDTAEEVLGYRNKNRPDWISEETWEAIQNRKQAKHILNQCRTRDQKEAASREYSRANRNVKRLFRRDKRKYINYLADKAQEAADRGDSKTLYVITKRLSRRKAFADSKPIKSKTGDLLVTEEAQFKTVETTFPGSPKPHCKPK
ncbi:craniofacial development protein 2-like [Homalodisca vitripennis]|uniref:craniofacial development protein 2-like n=1 Tax=Homalodisca vitripennis TaxID=197043 RepID=UPI001EEC2DCC|nr:craniofacial development protein 2-like [Homalodisca vitripennis]